MNHEIIHTESFIFSSPPGALKIHLAVDKIFSIQFTDEQSAGKGNHAVSFAPLMSKVTDQLEAYFSGKRFSFELPLFFKGTPFQQLVWKELQKIPFGKTNSYAQLALRLSDPKCIRAAAAANGKNPFAIVVPCHRVIGSDGSLTGYAGGIEKKRWLLEHENAHANGLQLLF